MRKRLWRTCARWPPRLLPLLHFPRATQPEAKLSLKVKAAAQIEHPGAFRSDQLPQFSERTGAMIRRTILLTLITAASLQAQVSYERILRAGQEPQNWLTYSGNYNGQRYSSLAQITPENVKNLELQWIFQARSLEKFEATPIMTDGIMYTVEAPNNIVALDAATGRVFWTYNYTPAQAARPCCGR